MSVDDTPPLSQRSAAVAVTSRLTRWRTLAFIALVLSTGITYWTGTASYEEQLTEIAVARGFSSDVFDTIRDSPSLKKLFVEAASDRELSLKLELALVKYEDRASIVLEAFGSNTQFQNILRRHGDVVIPIIDYFMINDVATLWAKSKAQELWDALKHRMPGKHSKSNDAAKPVYGPRLRGIFAIEAIHEDGHHFLGQFIVDAKGQVQRVQSDRIFEILKGLFADGIIELESKYRKDEEVAASDFAWAGADVLSVFAFTKAVKYLGKVATSGKPLEEAAVVRRTTMMGRSVLVGESVGKHVAGMAAKVAAIYLVVRHPSLLSGVFGALGKTLGLPAWLSILIGWWGIALAASLAIIPLLRGMTLLIAPIRWIAGAAEWALPARDRASRSSSP